MEELLAGSKTSSQIVLNVAVRGKTSKSTFVSSGVPQGTVLGPLLFLVYINNMPQEVLSQIALFADDAYLFRLIKSAADAEIANRQQQPCPVGERLVNGISPR